MAADASSGLLISSATGFVPVVFTLMPYVSSAFLVVQKPESIAVNSVAVEIDSLQATGGAFFQCFLWWQRWLRMSNGALVRGFFCLFELAQMPAAQFHQVFVHRSDRRFVRPQARIPGGFVIGISEEVGC